MRSSGTGACESEPEGTIARLSDAGTLVGLEGAQLRSPVGAQTYGPTNRLSPPMLIKYARAGLAPEIRPSKAR